MKIYTKTGDNGTTSLIGGQRVSKDDVRLEAYGTIDELNSFLGLLRSKTKNEHIKSMIFDIQNTLFAVGAHLATDKKSTAIGKYAMIEDEKIAFLEAKIDEFQNCLPKLTNFIIYGEDEISAICHCCRAIARRAERYIIAVNQVDKVDDNVMRYINRLSDFLFVLARVYTKNAGGEDFFWEK
ncbi:MAG: cob(I)yrinic acid a,c-diamide adenosyltransferase [Paludibacteraceae bacterium]|nr:cob(I)yrinic acid a,c-diamide adenosyltransferase [Paludibacteraceae bacterium]